MFVHSSMKFLAAYLPIWLVDTANLALSPDGAYVKRPLLLPAQNCILWDRKE